MVKTVVIRGVPHVYEITPPANSDVVLVFVHGWLLSREYWSPIIQCLSTRYQCLSYDLRGFGDSQPCPQTTSTYTTAPEQRAVAETSDCSSRLTSVQFASPSSIVVTESSESPYRPAAYAQDLIGLLQQLNLTNAWLIGHSLGGSIALWAADLLPSVVQGVICVNSGGGIYLKEEFERFRAAGQQLVKLRPRWLCYLPLMDLMMTRLNVVHPLARRWGRKRLLDWVMAHPEAALGALLDSTTEAEVHYLPQLIARLTQPVHFIAGANDEVMEPQYVRHLASFHRSFQYCGENVTEIPECGHLAMVEQPEAVAAEIQAILAQHQC